MQNIPKFSFNQFWNYDSILSLPERENESLNHFLNRLRFGETLLKKIDEEIQVRIKKQREIRNNRSASIFLVRKIPQRKTTSNDSDIEIFISCSLAAKECFENQWSSTFFVDPFSDPHMISQFLNNYVSLKFPINMNEKFLRFPNKIIFFRQTLEINIVF